MFPPFSLPLTRSIARTLCKVSCTSTQRRAISAATGMQTIKNVTERLAGQAANGYHQTDVTDLKGRVNTYGTSYTSEAVAEASCLF